MSASTSDPGAIPVKIVCPPRSFPVIANQEMTVQGLTDVITDTYKKMYPSDKFPTVQLLRHNHLGDLHSSLLVKDFVLDWESVHVLTKENSKNGEFLDKVKRSIPDDRKYDTGEWLQGIKKRKADFAAPAAKKRKQSATVVSTASTDFSALKSIDKTIASAVETGSEGEKNGKKKKAKTKKAKQSEKKRAKKGIKPKRTNASTHHKQANSIGQQTPPETPASSATATRAPSPVPTPTAVSNALTHTHTVGPTDEPSVWSTTTTPKATSAPTLARPVQIGQLGKPKAQTEEIDVQPKRKSVKTKEKDSQSKASNIHGEATTEPTESVIVSDTIIFKDGRGKAATGIAATKDKVSQRVTKAQTRKEEIGDKKTLAGTKKPPKIADKKKTDKPAQKKSIQNGTEESVDSGVSVSKDVVPIVLDDEVEGEIATTPVLVAVPVASLRGPQAQTAKETKSTAAPKVVTKTTVKATTEKTPLKARTTRAQASAARSANASAKTTKKTGVSKSVSVPESTTAPAQTSDNSSVVAASKPILEDSDAIKLSRDLAAKAEQLEILRLKEDLERKMAEAASSSSSEPTRAGADDGLATELSTDMKTVTAVTESLPMNGVASADNAANSAVVTNISIPAPTLTSTVAQTPSSPAPTKAKMAREEARLSREAAKALKKKVITEAKALKAKERESKLAAAAAKKAEKASSKPHKIAPTIPAAPTTVDRQASDDAGMVNMAAGETRDDMDIDVDPIEGSTTAVDGTQKEISKTPVIAKDTDQKKASVDTNEPLVLGTASDDDEEESSSEDEIENVTVRVVIPKGAAAMGVSKDGSDSTEDDEDYVDDTTEETGSSRNISVNAVPNKVDTENAYSKKMEVDGDETDEDWPTSGQPKPFDTINGTKRKGSDSTSDSSESDSDSSDSDDGDLASSLAMLAKKAPPIKEKSRIVDSTAKTPSTTKVATRATLKTANKRALSQARMKPKVPTQLLR